MSSEPENEGDETANEQVKIIQKVENPKTGDPTTQEIIDYLGIHADSNPAKQQEAVDLIAQMTDYTKETARNILEEEKSKKALDKFEMRKITKIIPINKEDETVYKFHISHKQEEHEFKVMSSELVTPTTFKQKILELTDHLLTFDGWNEQLNDWLENCEVNVREEEPLKDAHAVVEHIFSEFEMLQHTEDWKEFKQFSENMAYFDEGENEVLVSGRWIDSKVDAMNKEVSTRKVRDLLDEFMPAGGAKKVRVEEDLFRAWRFKKSKLSEIGVIDNVQGDE